MNELPAYFTVAAAARYWGFSRRTLSRWIAEGLVRRRQVGKRQLIPRAEIRRIEEKGLASEEK